jgi:HPt (histidine-containing phosphotransfer) domain-containing protein
MTATVYKKDRKKCLRVGMNDIISKPIRKQQFLQIVYDWLKSSYSRSPVDQEPSAKSGFYNSAGEKNPSIPINYPEALVEFEGDKRLLNKVIQDFLSRVESQLELIKKSLSKGELETIRAHVHGIKGGAANLIALPLAAIAGKLEKAARDGKTAETRKLINRLGSEFNRLKEFILPLD